ncbi:MAG: hypothetical protein WBV69_08765 [Candidatus Sulfotelmatobacter sp.]
MSHFSQDKNETTSSTKSKWDEAILDAKLRIADLKKTIEVYQARRDAGDPWPDVQLRGRAGRRQHSV